MSVEDQLNWIQQVNDITNVDPELMCAYCTIHTKPLENETTNTHEFGNNANLLLPAGDLERGDHFRLRKNGKWYTVHEKVIAVRHGDTCFSGDSYLIAVCSKEKTWIHSLTKVFACR